jgi:hypothetical protein
MVEILEDTLLEGANHIQGQPLLDDFVTED